MEGEGGGKFVTSYGFHIIGPASREGVSTTNDIYADTIHTILIMIPLLGFLSKAITRRVPVQRAVGRDEIPYP